MKKIFIMIILLAGSHALLAQVKTFNACTAEDVFKLLKGDSLVVKCDSVYAISSERFHNYELMRLTLQKNNSLLFGTITQMKQNYEKRIDQLNKDYSDMKSLYVKCDESSSGYLKKLDANITGTLSSLESANSKLETTQDLIKKSREEIKADMKKQLGSKLLWGAGGVVVELSVSSAIILLS
jgi:uncharacterized protein YbcI